ncbi:G-protein coupled receptor 151 [Brachyhypopomus gauderio]|uniref:G-protein coupled receptor 151 n=1 Tax=Brachyhypopomus gauderio TaxID=698409 RepID=UPI0040423535
MDNTSPGVNVSEENGTVDRRSVLDGGAYQHLENGELKVLIPVVLGVVCVLGFTGNVTAIGVLVSNARKGKLSLINALILNLMLADALVLAFPGPVRASAYSHASWTLGLSVCKTCDWFLHSCMAAKSFTVAVMAKACLRYVSNPTKQVSIRLKTMLVVLVFIWLLACALPIPHWLFAALREDGGGRVLCVQLVPPDARVFMSVYVKVYPLVALCAPLAAALLYFCRACGCRAHRRSSKTQNLRAQIRSRKLTLMVLGLSVAMGTLWVPEWVAWVWTRRALDGHGTLPPQALVLAAQLLEFAISLVNPLVVLALSEEFREGYVGLWRRLTMRKQPAKQPKPGPHAPTAPRSPTPRPETSAHLPPHQPGGDEGEEPGPEVQQEHGGGGGEDNPANKDGVVLPDVEQFWNEREGGSHSQENDPVPWERQ